MKPTLRIFLTTLAIFLSFSIAPAQKSTWKVLFPGYTSDYYKASMDPSGELNLVLKSASTTPNMYVSLDSTGYVTYQDFTYETALLHFKDDQNNRYQVSYSSPQLRIKKFNASGVLLYDHANTLTYPVSGGGGGGSLYQFIHSSNFLFTSSGQLVVCGEFKTDSIVPSGYEPVSAFFIDPATGQIISEYTQCLIEEVVTEVYLQEDPAGNINMVYFNKVWGNVYLKKISPSGALLAANMYADEDNFITKESVRVTRDFIYFIIEDANYLEFVLKITSELDTVYHFNTQLYDLGIIDFFDATNSTAYLSYDDGAAGAYMEIDSSGIAGCAATGFSCYGYKFAVQGGTCYSARNYFTEKDTACTFSACSNNFDPLTQQLIYGLVGSSNMYSDNNYASGHVLYIVSEISGSIPGVIGLINHVEPNFSGTLYFDMNVNCAPDSVEPGIQNRLIRLMPENKLLFTQQNGYFENRTDTGSHSLEAVPFNTTLTMCPVSIPFQITAPTSLVANNDIGIQDASGNLQDLFVSVNQTVAVPGIHSYFSITVGNLLPLPADGVVSLTFDPALFIGVIPGVAPDSVVGNTWYWHVTGIEPFNFETIELTTTCSPAAIPATPYTTTATVTNLNGESNLSNNTSTIQGSVLSSYDPNDKIVYPKGYGNIGLISPADSILDYRIRFQNTGSYLAYKIVVVDTIDPNLDISTFELMATSHACQLSFLDTNVVRFTFENILLPDSTTNEQLSHGFVHFKIRMKQALPVNTQILNQAHIYFDYNPAVATNQVINTLGVTGIDQPASDAAFTLFPNPATETIFVRSPENDPIQEIKVYNISGLTVKSISGNAVSGVNIGDLSPGFYFVKIRTRNHTGVRSFIKN